ncbi:iron-containing redox enzyme family protein [Paracraurococcus lichenis]|uniref:Iron-containing redox enzyme family protein n=1 Tax=Paracraurococcus lichenis TaxID=3064888 RepID=A0ABT9DVV9_9PROT|nr:iron-containing redox enzyme family protein [Paracraurococcus sp. LOR1-02]MDO9708035.1 iron-containing redox enzyme family protein [Paracraurococcus sp. LOR1-02]
MTTSLIMSAINEKIARSRAWSNPVFERSRRGPWSCEDARVIGFEYLAFTAAFPKMLSALCARVDDDGMRALLVEILHSELGSGNPENAHARLFVRLLASCLDAQEVTRALAERPQGRLPSTRDFLRGLQALYAEAPLSRALGAQYALEFQADNMLESLSRGFHAMRLDERNLEFFRVHEVEEKDHIRLMQIALQRLLHNGEDKEELMQGAQACTGLFSAFWHGIGEALARASPAAAPARGPSPDGMPAGPRN